MREIAKDKTGAQPDFWSRGSLILPTKYESEGVTPEKF